jgi:hypothetical protein
MRPVSSICASVKPTIRGRRPIPLRTATSDSHPPTGNPRMPAPALKAAVSAERPNDECAASPTIETDQKEKNQRFQSTAMNAVLISQRSRLRSTGPSSAPFPANTAITRHRASATSTTAIVRSLRPALVPTYYTAMTAARPPAAYAPMCSAARP